MSINIQLLLYKIYPNMSNIKIASKEMLEESIFETHKGQFNFNCIKTKIVEISYAL